MDVLLFIGCLAALFIVIEIFTSLFNNIYAPVSRQKISKVMQNKLFEKAVHVDLQYYDTPHFYNFFILSSANADTWALEVFNTFIQLLMSVFTVGGVKKREYIGRIFYLHEFAKEIRTSSVKMCF